MTSPTTVLPQNDHLLNISRQEGHLQSKLQNLLDAQSEGLLAGLGGAQSQDEASSTGTRTPTDFGSEIQKPHGIVPVRQPARKKLGLRGARRGIAKGLGDLANLKGEEGGLIEDELSQREMVLSSVQGFESKSTGLKRLIQEIESEDSSRRVEGLKQESNTLGRDIHEMETKLYEMKARHRHLSREIDSLNSSVQSKLSSYQSALTLAEKDTRKFLARPPVENHTVETGFWALPKERRTLEMAKDYYTEERSLMKSRLQAVQAERTALEEGGSVWEEVVQGVDTVEKALQGEMQRMQASSTLNADDENIRAMKEIIKTMQRARSRIESKLDHAERNKWRLLVCCIGAELEAMIQGQEVLEAALASASKNGSIIESNGETGRQMDGSQIRSQTPEGDPAWDSHSQDQSAPTPSLVDRSEDEDDGPGPELLISHHEDD